MSRVFYFSMGALVLLAFTHSMSVVKGDDWNDEPTTTAYSEEETTTASPGWDPTTASPGWGWPEVSGDNAAFGQVSIVQNLAGNQTQSAPSSVEGIAFEDYEVGIYSGSSQNSQIEYNSNSWTPGGGNATVADGTAAASSGGPYNSLNQGAAQNNSVNITGALAGGILSNPQTSSAISAGSLVLSSSGQASNGTNVNPGAGSGWGNTGWGNTGWGNTGWGSSGWKAADKKDSKSGKKTRSQSQTGWGSGWGSGWAANQTGSSASASSLGSGTDISQSVSSSDNITAMGVQDYDYYSMELAAEVSQATAIEGYFNGNGVSANSSDASASTQWQNIEFSSYPENNATLAVTDYATEVALQEVPTSTTTFSIGNITVSDWATASSGTNLVNQNNGWGSSSGWAAPTSAPPSGWKAPLVEQMGYPVVQ